MDMQQIEMEWRSCKNCQGPYKVSTKSPQMVCATSCEKYGMPAPGGLRSRLSARNYSKETINVSVTKPTKVLDKRNYPSAALQPWPTPRKIKKELGDTMNHTENKKTDVVLNGESKTEIGILPISALAIQPTKQNELKISTAEKTDVILPESSEDLQRNLKKVSLDSLTLLSRSANKLMVLMEESVRQQDVDKSIEGVQKLDPFRLDMAIKCANAISQTIQTQVNIVKEANKFHGGPR